MLLYALTILVSAFLLFQVQPVIAKIILPWFGGSAAVWTVCLLFFQMVLLLGYLYAHALVRYLKPRVQMVLHGALLLGSALALPIYPSAALKPSGTADPAMGIILLLAATVGLPYFLLSTTGPLIQAWYARRYKGAMPYRLYALSNAGSMFALVSYPFLFEPVYTTHQQAGMWSIGYIVFILLCGFTAFKSGNAPVLMQEIDDSAAQKPGARQYALWIALPACASVLLLAVTNHLSQNVAAIPLLWVLPLSLYLLSFILCFEGSGWYWRSVYIPLLGIALYAMSSGLAGWDKAPITILVALYSLGLFTCCMVCHGELVRLKPHPKYLTHFYLMISAGGALGGLLVGLLAPRVFHAFYELQLGLVACAALTWVVLWMDKELQWFRQWGYAVAMVTLAGSLALGVYLGKQTRDSEQGARLLVRNFYGALKVKDSGPPTDLEATRSLTHGTINHGEQFLNVVRRDLPTTYYGPKTGIGVAIRAKQKTGKALRIGVIGLGTGTVAAYGRLGDYVRYYEINPLVLGIAHKQFTFLDDCKCKVEVAMGDARLSLERELQQGHPENFDVLAVDAFSSDSIPVHLLTREAMQLYFKHLQPDGILAVHISNRYLDLAPVVQGEAAATNHLARIVDTDDDDTQDVFGATWVLVVNPQPGFPIEVWNNSDKLASTRKIRLWTDDYSNLFQILK
ncbi:MAG TPA: fused MFS/spermidine synthase [Candidatus Limnocylindrales bacterium]|nr:fused MFS/spermidine synthase [Candidatus Limnocylindrales bacterium]